MIFGPGGNATDPRETLCLTLDLHNYKNAKQIQHHFRNILFWESRVNWGSRSDGKPETPKTQLDHIWADNILYFIPDSEKSSR